MCKYLNWAKKVREWTVRTYEERALQVMVKQHKGPDIGMVWDYSTDTTRRQRKSELSWVEDRNVQIQQKSHHLGPQVLWIGFGFPTEAYGRDLVACEQKGNANCFNRPLTAVKTRLNNLDVFRMQLRALGDKWGGWQLWFLLRGSDKKCWDPSSLLKAESSEGCSWVHCPRLSWGDKDSSKEFDFSNHTKKGISIYWILLKKQVYQMEKSAHIFN